MPLATLSEGPALCLIKYLYYWHLADGHPTQFKLQNFLFLKLCIASRVFITLDSHTALQCYLVTSEVLEAGKASNGFKIF